MSMGLLYLLIDVVEYITQKSPKIVGMHSDADNKP